VITPDGLTTSGPRQPASTWKNCHTCDHDASCNRGFGECRQCEREANLQNPKPRHKPKIVKMPHGR
jgi:ribosomal protein S14